MTTTLTRAIASILSPASNLTVGGTGGTDYHAVLSAACREATSRGKRPVKADLFTVTTSDWRFHSAFLFQEERALPGNATVVFQNPISSPVLNLGPYWSELPTVISALNFLEGANEAPRLFFRIDRIASVQEEKDRCGADVLERRGSEVLSRGDVTGVRVLNLSRHADGRLLQAHPEDLPLVAAASLLGFQYVAGPSLLQILNEPTEDLEIFERARRALTFAGIRRNGDLVRRKNVTGISDIGRLREKEIEKALDEKGLYIGMDPGDWRRPSVSEHLDLPVREVGLSEPPTVKRTRGYRNSGGARLETMRIELCGELVQLGEGSFARALTKLDRRQRDRVVENLERLGMYRGMDVGGWKRSEVTQ